MRVVLTIAVLMGVLGISLGAESVARAQTLPRSFSVERFRLASDGAGIGDVEWGDVPAHLAWNVATWIGGADDPLVLYQVGDGGRLGSLVKQRTGGALSAAIGLYGRASLAIEVPFILQQSHDTQITGIERVPGLSSAGAGDVRLAVKLALLRQRKHGIDLAIMPAVTLPSGGHDSYFGDRSATFAPELAISRVFGGVWRAAANAGYRVRERTQALNLVVDDEVFWRAGAGRRFAGGHELDATVGGTVATTGAMASNTRALEVIGLGAYAVNEQVHAIGGGGIGLSPGFGTPDWRVFVGVRVEPAPRRPRPQPPVDTDGDGLYDAADRCPRERETFNAYQDDDGCPDAEPEVASAPDPLGTEGVGAGAGAGVPDPAAKPPAPAPPPADEDRDGDGVVDRIDNCPDEPGTVENQGCKDKQLVVITGDKLQILDIVYFKTDSAVILARSFPLLDNVAAVITSHPAIGAVRVEGHTDDVGADAYNLKLSQQRAEAVAAYLVGKGVAAARLHAQGFGETRPLAPGTSPGTSIEARAKNRRVEFVLENPPPDVQPAAH